MALRNFMGAVNRPEPGLWITLAAIPANALLAYALIYGAFGLPRARPARRRPCDHARQHRHVRRGDLGLLCAPPVPEISRARPLVARRLAADAATDRRRRADLRLVPARIRRVRRGRAADGLDRHGGARRASDRAADRRRSCSWCRSASAWRRPCASAMRSGAAMRRRRGAPASRRSLLGVVFMAAMTLLVALTRDVHSAAVPRPRCARSADGRARVVAAGARRELLHRRRHADHRGRRACAA